MCSKKCRTTSLLILGNSTSSFHFRIQLKITSSSSICHGICLSLLPFLVVRLILQYRFFCPSAKSNHCWWQFLHCSSCCRKRSLLYSSVSLTLPQLTSQLKIPMTIPLIFSLLLQFHGSISVRDGQVMKKYFTILKNINIHSKCYSKNIHQVFIQVTKQWKKSLSMSNYSIKYCPNSQRKTFVYNYCTNSPL